MTTIPLTDEQLLHPSKNHKIGAYWGIANLTRAVQLYNQKISQLSDDIVEYEKIPDVEADPVYACQLQDERLHWIEKKIKAEDALSEVKAWARKQQIKEGKI